MLICPNCQQSKTFTVRTAKELITDGNEWVDIICKCGACGTSGDIDYFKAEYAEQFKLNADD